MCSVFQEEAAMYQNLFDVRINLDGDPILKRLALCLSHIPDHLIEPTAIFAGVPRLGEAQNASCA